MYRVFRHERKKKLKVTHAVVNATSLLFAVIGLRAVFAYHDAEGIHDMYSLHSWMGIITVTLFAFQVLYVCTTAIRNVYFLLKNKCLSMGIFSVTSQSIPCINMLHRPMYTMF